ncbi:fatty acid-binding protein, adipocyte-like [Mizuhopecten yessoensis]|uniref:Fatty acid-binding protein, adipocyte n=1 Tax=Mizuhopecten yessoensis TaxID=6573 RepID=A0A210Q0F8_MIZYE|nr:fatty acid-binding protein, adipocyte-like [Mizuhopecten yessoensis]OWF42231.1 Fatty acid-binding protein, adipocyte [Mizuhopecten yessoensis]
MEETPHFASGTWKLTRSENFGSYCRCMGVCWLKRKLGFLICPCQTIRVTRGRWSICTSSPVGQTDVQLIEGQECTWLTYDGRMVRTSVNLENDQLVLHQLDPPFSKITRTFDEQTMVMTLEANGVKAKRIYQKLDTTDVTDGKASGWSRILLFASVCLSAVSLALYSQ